MKRLISILAAAACLAACSPKAAPLHPEWTYNSVVYEVNIRQFSPEGNFKGVEAQLPRLKDLGVDVLWLMPMYKIGEVERKGSMGSYYAISDYTAVNPEFGTMQDFDELLSAAHAQGFKVILDWVANQTAPDHVWMETRPADYYERDSLGNAIYEYDWNDTRSLLYDNETVWAAQDSCMRFWLEKGVDGFRCDAAAEVPAAFWKGILPKLNEDYPDIYLLAEAENDALTDASETFDASYAWKLHHMLNDVAQGTKSVKDIREYLAEDDAWMGPSNFRLMFTSNHDENSWAGSEFERMGDAAKVMEVLCFTLPKGQPLVYTGQEIGLQRRLQFFEKDPITDWSANGYTSFIRDLIAFRHAHPCLAAGEEGAPAVFIEDVPEGVLAFSRAKGKDKVTVYANLTPAAVSVPFENGTLELGPWGWSLFPTPETSLSSPDGTIKMDFTLSEAGTPYYSLSIDGQSVVLPSRLGFELRGVIKAQDLHYEGDGSIAKEDGTGSVALDRGFVLTGTRTDSFDETWEPVWGEESSIRNHYNELLVQLCQKESGRRMDIRFRLFDDGLGFRYEFPSGQSMVHFVIKEELTEFAMADDCTAWWIPGDFDTQEYEYNCTRLSEIGPHFRDKMRGNSSQTPFDTWGVQTSLQMKTPGGIYVNIHEAALVDYPCMHLLVDGRAHSLRAFLTPDAQGWKGNMQTPGKTPWRTVQLARSATGQLASRLVLNLNEPCALEDVSWIHPVKYMGVWWEMIAGAGSWAYTDAEGIRLDSFDYASAKPNGRHSANNEKVRRYIDFASAHGFDAVLVEGWNIGWEEWANCNKDYVFDFLTPYPDFDIAALNAYAHSKGIRLVMHHETSSSVRNYERHMEAAYTLMNKYGYDAVKSGYVGDILPQGQHHYSQWMVNHYQYALEQAAAHHIMVNAHEAVRPTGLCRTWPNLIGNESAMGTEYQAFGGITPGHTAILPFTRLNGGPMDYTPGIFEQNLKDWCGNDSYVNTTICGQLGLYVTMYSPLQMAADTPEHYSRFLDAFRFIEDVAVDWDESRYLFAEPMEYIVAARRSKAGQWFCGGVTDTQERSFDIPLDFLGEGSFTAKIYADAPSAHYKDNPQAYDISTRTVVASDSIRVTMKPGGGFAISFEPCK